MSPYARHIFYINHPDLISDSSTFRSNCAQNEQTIVLGCYHSGENGIYVYDVSKPELTGVIQVTSAHEMLHGAYERLSNSDKNYVNNLLQDYYQHDLHDQRLLDVINSYKQTEPNDVLDEMHSVFGTEASNLPTALENYYKRYFTNRSAVTIYAANYESVFTNLEAQLNTDKSRLDALKQQINSEENSLNIQYQQINSDRAKLDQERASGQVAAYNAGVPVYNSEVNNYNSAVAALRDDIASYNSLVQTYNALGAQLANLERSIDTRAVPQTVSR